jgi:hypothetical protein
MEWMYECNLSFSGRRPVGNYCEFGNEFWISLNFREYFDHLSYYLIKNVVPWSI